MSVPLLPAWRDVRTPIIGLLHAPALPGAPAHRPPLAAIRDFVLRDAAALVAGGVDGLMLENFNDAPFFPGAVPAGTIAALTELASAVRRAQPDTPLGINVLRNDGVAALAIALAVEAAYIRVNVLCGARVTDQGVIQGAAHQILRDRAALRAEHVRIWADVDVKHSAPLGPPRPIEDEVDDTLARGGADALIVSGAGTGKPTDIEKLRRVKNVARHAPVLVGSGVTPENAAALSAVADGLIVGTALKQDGVATNPVDVQRVRRLVSAAR